MLNNLNVLVTGGNKGIGKAIVMKLLEYKANVYFTYNSDIESSIQTQEEAFSKGHKTEFYQLDLGSPESIHQFSSLFKSSVKDLNILINNAGYLNDSLFVNADLNKWWDVFNMLFRGTIELTYSLLPLLVMQDYSRIINMSSISGIMGLEGQTNYSSAKAAINGFTKSLSRELARIGVNVNAIAPGYIDTDMVRKTLNADKMKKIKNSIPMNRLGRPEEIAEVAAFLSSKMSSYINGKIIIVDGGIL